MANHRKVMKNCIIVLVILILVFTSIVSINAVCIGPPPCHESPKLPYPEESVIGSLGNSRLIFSSKMGEVIDSNILVRNINRFPVKIQLSTEGYLKDNIELINTSFFLNPNQEENVIFKIYVNKSGTSEGKIIVKFFHINQDYWIELNSRIILIVNDNSAIFPEVLIKYDSVNKTLIISGDKDSTSINKSEKCFDKKCLKRTESYLLTNEFGNNLRVVIDHKKTSSQDSFNLLSIQYNNDNEIKFSNKFSIFDLNNKIYTRSSNKTTSISLDFNKPSNKTNIQIKENRKINKSIINGLGLIEVKTLNGSLNYIFL